MTQQDLLNQFLEKWVRNSKHEPYCKFLLDPTDINNCDCEMDGILSMEQPKPEEPTKPE